jgi:hypothetical protein
LPLNLTLAIDTSGSVRKDLTEEATAARRFAHAIVRPQDQMSVMQFATEVRALTPFTNNMGQIDRGLNQLHSDFATALYDAIYQGSERLGPKDGRKVLVVVSDGDDTVQSTTYAQALEQALRNEVMIYSLIDVPIEASAGRDTGGEHALLCGGWGPRCGFQAGERRSADAISAGLLSAQPGTGTDLPPDSGDGATGIGHGLRRAAQDRVLRGFAGRKRLTPPIGSRLL